MRGRGAGAFTLVELILVMVLICIILGAAAPSLRGFFSSRKTANAAAHIMGLIQYARTQAIADGCNYRLNFDTTQNTYWLTVQSGSAFVAINTEYGITHSLPEGASFDLQADPNATITDHIDFYPDGSTSAAAIGVIPSTGQADEQEICSGYNTTLTDSYRIVTPPSALTGGTAQ
jgi:prepilin-type N-terminal cleavage/methylation domain-containing protein